MEEQVKQFTPFCSGLLQSFHHAFLDYLHEEEKKPNAYLPPDLLKASKSSEKLREDILAAKRIGNACLKQAKWIGLNKYVYILYFSTVIRLNCYF